jgi:hypothetical protein
MKKFINKLDQYLHESIYDSYCKDDTIVRNGGYDKYYYNNKIFPKDKMFIVGIDTNSSSLATPDYMVLLWSNKYNKFIRVNYKWIINNKSNATKFLNEHKDKDESYILSKINEYIEYLNSVDPTEYKF